MCAGMASQNQMASEMSKKKNPLGLQERNKSIYSSNRKHWDMLYL